MKKTIIALLALGSISQAALTLDATDVYNYDWDTNVTSAAVTLILSADAITALDNNQTLNQVFAAFDITGGSAGAGTLSPTHFAIENTTYTVDGNTTTAFRASDSGVPKSFSNTRFQLFTSGSYSGAAAWDTAKYAALTFGITTSNNYKARAVLSVIDASGIITNITQAEITNKIAFTGISGVNINNEDEDYVTGSYIYSGSWDNNALTTITEKALTAAIPEPTTATLSLLALAGLAARRRRK